MLQSQECDHQKKKAHATNAIFHIKLLEEDNKSKHPCLLLV